MDNVKNETQRYREQTNELALGVMNSWQKRKKWKTNAADSQSMYHWWQKDLQELAQNRSNKSQSSADTTFFTFDKMELMLLVADAILRRRGTVERERGDKTGI